MPDAVATFRSAELSNHESRARANVRLISTQTTSSLRRRHDNTDIEAPSANILIMEGVPPGIQLSSQCSTVANRSAQLSIGFDKLAAQTNAGSLIHDELRELASIVSALSQGAEELSANLASANNLREQVRRQISLSMSSCEILVGGVTTDLEAALSASAREQSELQPFTDAAELWRLHIEMVFAFQDIVHLEDVDQQQGVFAALETKLEDIERLMAEFHLSHPGPAPAAPEPSIPLEKQGVLPDYDTAVASSSTHVATTPSSDVGYQHDNAQQEVPLYHDLSQRKGQSKAKSARAKGVFGGFNNIFKTLSSKINPIEPLVTPLCHAAAIGNIPQIKGLLGEGANINGHNEKGYTPLISAILANRLEAVNFLIDNYAKISTKDSTKNMPPLFHAAEAGYTDILKVLLSHGADPKASNTIGTPHFIGTVEKAPLASVALLLEHGADPNAVSAVGRHVLVAAVQRKDLPAVRLLLDHGAKISATNFTGQPLLGVAVANKQLDMVKLLIDNGADVNARAGANGCPLSMAVNSGNIDLLRLLLASNANPDGKDVKSAPVLVSAISSGSLEMVTMLLEAGADADSRDITGRAVLLLAVQQDKLHIARLLLEHGAAATISNHSGTHFLTVVAKQPVSNEGEKLELMRLLLKAGANPNKHSLPWGYLSNMPLGHCIKHDKIELVRVLVEGGADPHITVAASPHSPKSPFEYALNHDKVDAMRIMLEYQDRDKKGYKERDPLKAAFSKAVETGKREIVDMFLDQGFGTWDQAIFLAGTSGQRELLVALEQRQATGLRRASQAGSSTKLAEPSGSQDADEAPPAYGSRRSTGHSILTQTDH